MPTASCSEKTTRCTGASAILLCNRDSIDSLPKKWTHKAHLFPVSGISVEDLSFPIKAKSENKPFNVVSAGTLIRVKGFGLAIKSFKEFSDSHPDSKLSIFGSGPEEARLKVLVRQTGLQDKVEFVGAVPRNVLIERIASSDVFLFPSLRDGGGTVVVEAMSVGKPVVCLDIGGPGMHITEDCGIKVTPSSPKETIRGLAEALERLYLDRELGFRMGRAARDRAALNYHWDKLGDRLNVIYQTTMTGLFSE